jgi:hypothetical protein
MDGLQRMDRRQAIKWMLAAAAALPVLESSRLSAAPGLSGYGTDPKLMDAYKPGDLWPLTFTTEQRRAAAALCDVILPADEKSPAASQLLVHDFIDEWISAPYPKHQTYRTDILEGLAWLDAESQKRFQRQFVDLTDLEKHQICDDICHEPEAKRAFKRPAHFFARFRDLTTGGFYTTPEGMKDLPYTGNVALTRFDGPPPEVLAHLKLR